jgi:hypothetical protein
VAHPQRRSAIGQQPRSENFAPQRPFERARDAFGYDELGWVVGEAATLTSAGDWASDAHRRSVGLALLARHPRLLGPVQDALEGPARIAGSAYVAEWRSGREVAAAPGEAIAIVMFGARGGVGVAPRAGFAENFAVRCGRVLVLAPGETAGPLPGAAAGPAFVARYAAARDGNGELPSAEDSLWPSAWCAAG